MKILIVEASPVKSNTSIAHVRNAIEITNHLKQRHDCKLVDFQSKIDVTEQFDIILYSAASFYMDFVKFNQLMDNQKKCQIGWITNEFELFANDFVKQRMTFMITNFEESGIKQAHRHDQLLMTNLNTLIAKPRNVLTEKKYDVCYYGTWRKYRMPYFKKYFDENMLVSTSIKNVRKFMDIEQNFKITDKFAWDSGQETLNLFKASLYIEDTKTHNCFNFMANRFYEGLFCNTALFFDVSCKNTILKDKYEIDDYFIVDGSSELYDKVKSIDQDKLKHFLKTNNSIALDERAKVLFEIEDYLVNIAGI